MKVQGEDTGETRIKKNKNKDIINVVFLPRKRTILLDRIPRENNCCTYKQHVNKIKIIRLYSGDQHFY